MAKDLNDEEMDDLVLIWKEYGKEADSKLTQDAQELKRAVRKYIQNLPKFVWYFRTGDFSTIPNKKEAKL